MRPARILIADDHELVRKGLISILEASHPEWKIVAEVSSGREAIQSGEDLHPDVAILDLSMPDVDGIAVAERLLRSVPGVRILVLSIHAAAPILHQLKKAGVSAYMDKQEAPKTLVSAVEHILEGRPFFASGTASRTIDELNPAESVPAQFLLTPRELEVMRMLAQGKSNKELAAELEMSVRTAESHHASLLAKLGANSLGDIVRIAIRDGVV